MATDDPADADADAPPPPPPPPTPPPPHHLERLPRVLSIQSHVAAGRVGNRAALFPLALHRLDCDAVNTVSFSNHTGYPTVAGSRLSAEGLEELLGGLERNGFLTASRGRRGYDYILTGYVGRAETLSAIKGAIETMLVGGSQKGSQRPLVVVDPVMVRRFLFFFFLSLASSVSTVLFLLVFGGENRREKREREASLSPRKTNVQKLTTRTLWRRGKKNSIQGDHDRARAGPSSSSPSLSSSLYVPEDVPDVYRSLLPLADVITPNAFEAEMLLSSAAEGEGEGEEGEEGEKGNGGRRRFEIVDEASAIAACSALHSKGPGIVVLTSVAFPPPSAAAAAAAAAGAGDAPPKTLTLYASQCRRGGDGDGDGAEEEETAEPPPPSRFPPPPAGATAAAPAVWRLELPRVDAPFTGTGDLLAALLLAFLHKAGAGGGGAGGSGGGGGEGGEEGSRKDLGWALERAAAGVRAVVDATVAGAAAEAARAAAEEQGGNGGEGAGEHGSGRGQQGAAAAPLSSSYWASPRAVAARELRLVQCADALVSPRVVARAERIQ